MQLSTQKTLRGVVITVYIFLVIHIVFRRARPRPSRVEASGARSAEFFAIFLLSQRQRDF